MHIKRACAGLGLALTTLWLAATGPASAQIASGTLTGIVADPTGATVPKAKVAAQNVATGVTRGTETNEVGAYNIPLLQPGTYKLTVEAGGFSSVVVEGILIQVNVISRRDVSLKVAAAAEQITVQAAPVAVNSESATLGEIIQSKKITELPLNGRNFLSLAALSPGVVPNSGLESAANTVSVSGVRFVSVAYLYDGVSNKSDYYGSLTLQTPVDAIEEFKVQRGYFSAQFGLAAVINLVTKSGTNEIHGAAWEFVKNQILDSRNTFDYGNPSRGVKPKAPYRYNQYGFMASGPLIKNKLFWLGTYEAARDRRSGTGYGVVPTTEMLNGDFTGQATIYDPTTLRENPDKPGSFLRSPFAGNRIPSDRVHPFAAKYKPFVNTANTPLLFGTYNFANSSRSLGDVTKWDIRVDYKKSDKDSFFGRMSFQDNDSISTSLRPYAGSQTPIRSRGPVAAWTHIFSPALLNEFRWGIDHVNSGTILPETGPESWPQFFGLKNINEVPMCNAVPVVLLGGYGTYGGLNSCTVSKNSDWIFNDNLIWHRGRHNITMGVELRQVRFDDIAATFHNGWLDFSGRFTGGPDATTAGNPVANFLLGSVNNVQGMNLRKGFLYRGKWWAGYINDDFRIHKDFTLNLGLRYQYTEPLKEVNDEIVGFNFSGEGSLMVAGKDGNPRSFINPRKRDLAPRFGFAWVPFGKQNWSVRGSYGVFFDKLPGNEWIWQSVSPPFNTAYSENSDPIRPTIQFQNLFPTYTPSLVGVSPIILVDRGSPYLQMWTLTLQRTLPGQLLFEAGYVGSKGTHLSKRYDDNLAPQPPAAGDTRPVQDRRRYPKWGFILADHGDATSSYNSLQLSLRKSFGRGVSFLSAYTWGHSLDMDSFDQGKATRNYRKEDRDRTRSVFDIRERFVANFVWELPWGQGLKGIPKQVVYGWQLNGIVTWQSGGPFHVLAPYDTSNTGSFWMPRVNRICNGNLPRGERTLARWFDTGCFVMPEANTYGNSPLQFLNLDGLHGLDAGVYKNFPITERFRLQFRSEFFNALNNTTWGGPGTQLGSPSFGKIASASGARNIQLALKLLW